MTEQDLMNAVARPFKELPRKKRVTNIRKLLSESAVDERFVRHYFPDLLNEAFRPSAEGAPYQHTCNAQKLAVRLTASPGVSGKQYVVTLRDVTANATLLSATCNGVQTCDSGATITSLPAAHQISIQVATSGNPNAADVQFGWECRP